MTTWSDFLHVKRQLQYTGRKYFIKLNIESVFSYYCIVASYKTNCKKHLIPESLTGNTVPWKLSLVFPTISLPRIRRVLSLVLMYPLFLLKICKILYYKYIFLKHFSKHTSYRFQKKKFCELILTPNVLSTVSS